MESRLHVKAHFGGVFLKGLTSHGHFCLTPAQARTLVTFCTAPDLSEQECVSFSAGHKSGVEIASCLENYTVIFTHGDDVCPEMIRKTDLPLLGRKVHDALLTKKAAESDDRAGL